MISNFKSCKRQSDKRVYSFPRLFSFINNLDNISDQGLFNKLSELKLKFRDNC